MPAPEPILRLRGITKRFGALVANDGISLDLAAGEVLALLGENGAGKSTLVSILFGHYVADAGSIEVFGRPLPPGQPRAALAAGIGMVHQHFTLADNLSVLDNVMLGTEPLWQPFSRRAAARFNSAKSRPVDRMRRCAASRVSQPDKAIWPALLSGARSSKFSRPQLETTTPNGYAAGPVSWMIRHAAAPSFAAISYLYVQRP